MGFSGGSSGGPMGEINVTPLVDVMLVLLIIFMVTAPMLNQGVDIDLPKASAGTLTPDEDQLVLSIDGDLKHYLNKNEVSLEELPAKLKAIAKENPGKPVFVAADGGIEYQHVMRAMAVLKQSGMPKVGLLSNPGEFMEEIKE